MKTVIIYERDANDIMAIVQELREQNLWQGKDFDFSYHQAHYDHFSHDPLNRKHTKFYFYNEKWATFFLLKYNGTVSE